MNDIFSNLLYFIGISTRATDEEAESPQFVSITKYSELTHPVKCEGSYIDTYKAKNYHYHFDQCITQPSQNSK